MVEPRDFPDLCIGVTQFVERLFDGGEAKRKEAAEAEARRKAEEEAEKAEALRKEAEAKRKEEGRRRREAAIAAAKPGYVWDDGSEQYFWKPGLRHPDNKRLVSDTTTGQWKSAEDGYVWTGGSNTEWRAGLRHSKVPHATSAEEEEYWTADPGYKWVEQGNIQKGVVWEKGRRNYRNRDLVSGAVEGSWVSTRPGYEWDYGTNLIWKQGLRHPDNDKLVSATLRDTWKSTKDGYAWTGGSNTEWRKGLPHSKIAHVKSAAKEGYWIADSGYKWVQNGDGGMSKGVEWNPGEIDGDRKAASVEGQWLRKCRACDGEGRKDCWECGGDHKVTCPACRGNKEFVTKVPWMVCPGCGGAKKVLNVMCPKANNPYFVVCTVPSHPLFGKHLFFNMYSGCHELCATCGGNGVEKIDCKKCAGEGHLYIENRSSCMRCLATGSVLCPKCTDGKRKCPTCNGMGWRNHVPAYL